MSASLRKPRSDSKLDALDMDQQRQLCEWLLTPGLSYEVIKKQVFEQFNVSTSSASLSCFYQSYCGAYLVQRRMQAAGVAREVGEEAARDPGQFTQAAIDALEQKAFEFANNPMVNPKDVKAIFALVLKAHDQQLDRQKFRRETCELFLKWEADARAKQIASGSGTNAEKIEALGQAMFGEDWED